MSGGIMERFGPKQGRIVWTCRQLDPAWEVEPTTT
jgi:hypothetical protein